MSKNGSTGCAGSAGIGFTSALTLLFVALKLTGVIEWSWVWVLSPMWISFVLSVAIVIFFMFALYRLR